MSPQTPARPACDQRPRCAIEALRMHRATPTALIALSIALLFITPLACSSVHVESTHDAAVNFSSLHTYAWLRPPTLPREGSKSYGWRVREAVDRDLAAKGFAPATTGAPDFLINYSVQTRRTYEARDIPAAHSETTDFGRTGSGDAYRVESQEGTLVLMILDPSTKKLIWRAEANTSLSRDLSPEKLTQRVNNVVAKLLAGFPP
jgi:uncharacterized protein DUF4136